MTTEVAWMRAPRSKVRRTISCESALGPAWFLCVTDEVVCGVFPRLRSSASERFVSPGPRDLAADRLWKARDRLTGLLAHRQDFEVLDLLATVHHEMQDLRRQAHSGSSPVGTTTRLATPSWRGASGMAATGPSGSAFRAPSAGKCEEATSDRCKKPRQARQADSPGRARRTNTPTRGGSQSSSEEGLSRSCCGSWRCLASASGPSSSGSGADGTHLITWFEVAWTELEVRDSRRARV